VGYVGKEVIVMMQQESNEKIVGTISRREVKRYKYTGKKIMLECVKENINV
jgi:hypothetical protein